MHKYFLIKLEKDDKNRLVKPNELLNEEFPESKKELSDLENILRIKYCKIQKTFPISGEAECVLLRKEKFVFKIEEVQPWDSFFLNFLIGKVREDSKKKILCLIQFSNSYFFSIPFKKSNNFIFLNDSYQKINNFHYFPIKVKFLIPSENNDNLKFEELKKFFRYAIRVCMWSYFMDKSMKYHTFLNLLEFLKFGIFKRLFFSIMLGIPILLFALFPIFNCFPTDTIEKKLLGGIFLFIIFLLNFPILLSKPSKGEDFLSLLFSASFENRIPISNRLILEYDGEPNIYYGKEKEKALEFIPQMYQRRAVYYMIVFAVISLIIGNFFK